jgi:hypothetical protein
MHYTISEKIKVGVAYGDLMCSSPRYYEMSSVTRRLYSWSGLIPPIVIRVSERLSESKLSGSVIASLRRYSQ